MSETKQFRPRLSEEEYKLVLKYRGDEIITSPNQVKILVFDIETAPLMGFVWSVWKQNVHTDQIISDWFMLTWSAKWLFSEEIMSDKLTAEEAINSNDKRITQSIWDLMDEADIVIAHNGDKFDIRKLNTRFLKHGMGHPRPYQSIDTLKHARKSLNFANNRLDNIARELGAGRKMDDGGFETWVGCLRGDEEALALMEEYNIHDVKVLEDVYLILRPYIKPHPNLGIFIGDDVERCPTCGGSHLKSFGEYVTYSNAYESFKCVNCGSVSRSRKTATPLAENRNLRISLP